MQRGRVLVALALCALAAAARAQDSVDLQVRGNEKVQGTLRPAEERENFLVEAPLGARITASVKAQGTGGPVPQLDLVDDALTVLATGTTRGRSTKLAPFTAASSEMLAVRVFGDGELDGDYQLKLKVTPQKTWPGESEEALAGATETEFEFHAPANASCSIDLRSAARSPMTPRIVRV